MNIVLGSQPSSFLARELSATRLSGPVGISGRQFDLGFLAGELQHHVDGIDDLNALHGAEIHGRAVVDFFSGQDGAGDDVVDVGPVADLRAVAPDLERILADEGAGDHGDDGVIFDAARAVDGEVAAGGRLHASLRARRPAG